MHRPAVRRCAAPTPPSPVASYAGCLLRCLLPIKDQCEAEVESYYPIIAFLFYGWFARSLAHIMVQPFSHGVWQARARPG